MRSYLHVACACLLVVSAFGSDRNEILDTARSLIGTTEATGNNDGPAVDAILSSVGLEGTGAPWCAAFNRRVYDLAGFRDEAPRSALAADWVRNPTWKRGTGQPPLPGDPWGIYFPSKGRVAHTGLVEKWGDSVVVTIEGNTAPQAIPGSPQDRDGDGVWRKRRIKTQIYAVQNWLN